MNDSVTHGRRWFILASCCLSLLLVTMDVTIVNVILPSIRHAFGAGISGLQWIVDAYTLVVAAFLMLAGSVADRIGRRRVFLTGVTTFCIGSALCGLAATTGQMIAARVFQGIGGAMMNPVALSIIANTFLDPRERARAIGIWGMMSGAALAFGPMVGGFVSDWIGWRFVFWINLPVGVVALLMTLRFVPESKASIRPPLDLPAQVLSGMSSACLVAALIEGPDAGWMSAWTPVLILLSFLAFSGFIVVEVSRANPVLDLRLFRSIPFASAIVLAVLCFAVFSSLLFLNTIYLQDIRGLLPRQAGLRLMPLAIAVMVAAPLSGRLVASRGARLPLVLSGIGLALGSLLMTGLSVRTPEWQLILAYVLVGIGFGLCNAPITNAAISGMPRRRAGIAAAVASSSRQIGASLGVAVAGSVRSGTESRGFTDAFLATAHPVFWLAGTLGVAVSVCGVIATGRRARQSAEKVAAVFS
ncbi:MFS transporter [Acetobacter oeni]|uniref:MFS transporter n=1 Tax=Acetobacter oeni TaxID=304077 RepID=A0A511XHZ6_9PROT|nr:MFS transporter [Acetobacter oeni]MBB3883002.1 EmrB/QacA subfamily drug resistance transporter [Acetobacter oeni]NHO19078.1 DHA2 family efflux MFS transporter permease subunit [Acetobacter oeni]GBR11694.1 major facilitator superfamily multidrug resistance transporter QacA [Acetobacter oeni LMG 21952]GEN62586.1 MFS transporter [Acetobacter oeni]